MQRERTTVEVEGIQARFYPIDARFTMPFWGFVVASKSFILLMVGATGLEPVTSCV